MPFLRCVITGGIGSGKTTLLDAIKAESRYWCADEQALDLVRSELESNGENLPWTRPEEVSRIVIPKRIALFDSAPVQRSHCIFDRGIPDSIAFLRMAKVQLPEFLIRAAKCHRYDLVFWAPPWKEIYRNRAERQQPWSHAEPLGYMLRDVYSELGYEVIELPCAGVADRVAFVLKRLTE